MGDVLAAIQLIRRSLNCLSACESIDTLGMENLLLDIIVCLNCLSACESIDTTEMKGSGGNEVSSLNCLSACESIDTRCAFRPRAREGPAWSQLPFGV